jgi:hypothetical protein
MHGVLWYLKSNQTDQEPLTDRHDFAGFACGREMLDTWLTQRALRNQDSGASRIFVVCDGR